jgi:putative restriction endonuclease
MGSESGAFALHLAWFASMAGQQVPREDIRIDDGLLIGAQGGKVIFKPAGSDKALSIQVLIDSFYGPEEVHRLPSLGGDGDGWLLRYHREQRPESSDADADELWTNRALVANMRAGQPVGVLIQTSRSPSTFLVQGLGYVVKQEGRRFWVASHNEIAAVEAAVRRHLGADAIDYWRTEDRLTPPEALEMPRKDPGAAFDPRNVADERERVRTDIVRRQGQGKFRADVLHAYNYRCAVTENDVEAVLEAAHILPYRGPAQNDVRNGILLRADLHTLMDRHLLRIDPETRRVVLHPSLHDSPYAELNNTQIREPLDPRSQPHRRYLEAAWNDGDWTGE